MILNMRPMPSTLDNWKRRARHLKAEVYALYLAYRDPRVPWYGKVLAACVVGYAISPIDLIPDFIPGLGYLDDLVLIPLGVVLAVRMIPSAVMGDARRVAAEQALLNKPSSWYVTVGIVLVWLGVVYLVGRWVWRLWQSM